MMDLASVISSLFGGGDKAPSDSKADILSNSNQPPTGQPQPLNPLPGQDFMQAPKPGGGGDLLGSIIKMFLGGG